MNWIPIYEGERKWKGILNRENKCTEKEGWACIASSENGEKLITIRRSGEVAGYKYERIAYARDWGYLSTGPEA